MLSQLSSRVAPMVAVTSLALALAPGAAQAASRCSNEPMAAVFQDYDGDANSYFAAPGGLFERSGYGSSYTAARTGTTSLVARAHSYQEAGTTALSMADGSTVTTGSVCVDNDRNWLRFIYKPAAATSTLKVEAIPSDGEPVLLGTVLGVPNVWDATDLVPLAPSLAIPAGASRSVQIRITAIGSSLVDGIGIDPYRGR